MKKIVFVFLISFLLTGCTLPIDTTIDNDNTNSSGNPITIDQEIIDQIKEQVKSEILDEIQQEQRQELTSLENMMIDIVNNDAKGVLGVSNFQLVKGVPQEVGTGSGVIYKRVNNDYYLVTNEHVVDDSVKLSVVLPDKTYIDATLVGADAMTDLAVLKFTTSKSLTVSEFGNSDTLIPGQIVIAVGNPLGYEYYSTITMGIVSGLSRNLEIDHDNDNVIDWNATLIQHDAAISPGNSGGPLFDIKGDIIGINNMKIVQAEVNGIGFAIPSSTVQYVIGELESKGKVERPSLGIIGTEVGIMLNSDERNLIPADITSGVYVRTIIENSSSSNTDLKVGDIIVKFGTIDIKTFDDLRLQINNSKIGDMIALQVNRNGTIVTIFLTLKERPNL